MTRRSRIAVISAKGSCLWGPFGLGAWAVLMVASALFTGVASAGAAPAPPSEAPKRASSPATASQKPAAAPGGAPRVDGQPRPQPKPLEWAATPEVVALERKGYVLKLTSFGTLAGSVVLGSTGFVMAMLFNWVADDLARQEQLTDQDRQDLRAAARDRRTGLWLLGAGATLGAVTVVLLTLGAHFQAKARRLRETEAGRLTATPWLGGQGGGLSVRGSF